MQESSQKHMHFSPLERRQPVDTLLVKTSVSGKCCVEEINQGSGLKVPQWGSDTDLNEKVKWDSPGTSLQYEETAWSSGRQLQVEDRESGEPCCGFCNVVLRSPPVLSPASFSGSWYVQLMALQSAHVSHGKWAFASKVTVSPQCHQKNQVDI